MQWAVEMGACKLEGRSHRKKPRNKVGIVVGGSCWGHGASCPLGHPLSMAINNHWFSLVFTCQILKSFWFKKLDYTCTEEDPVLRLKATCINTMLSTCRNKSILHLSPWNKEFIIKTLPGIPPPLESTYRRCWYFYSNKDLFFASY
jgi:hypothetical protein